MKNCYFLLFLILIACSDKSVSNENSSNNDYNIHEIRSELSGIVINDSLAKPKRKIITENSETKIFYKAQNKKINEIDIHITSKQDSTFPILVNYYNQMFNSNKNDSIFNSWHTDSSEFILYKNSDSSILVNIFKRTYL